MGLALLMYQKEESAETLIETLAGDKDPLLRAGAMHMVALAYAGTANNAAVRRLLHVAVSDVSDDVRRAAVTALGYGSRGRIAHTAYAVFSYRVGSRDWGERTRRRVGGVGRACMTRHG
jgi:hypothetical protein